MSNAQFKDTTLLAPPVIAELKPGLESRVTVRKRELIAELIEFKKRTGPSAVESVSRLRGRLSELDHLVKWGVPDGFDKVSDAVRARLDLWVDQ
jgi:hypothetical protein